MAVACDLSVAGRGPWAGRMQMVASRSVTVPVQKMMQVPSSSTSYKQDDALLKPCSVSTLMKPGWRRGQANAMQCHAGISHVVDADHARTVDQNQSKLLLFF